MPRVRTATRPGLRASALAVIAVLAVAGCGSSTTDTYKQNVKKASETFKNSAQAASNQLQSAGATTQQRYQALDALVTASNKAADDFSKAKPPSDAQSDNNRLVTDLRKFAVDIGSVKAALTAKNANAAKQSVVTLQSDQAEIQSAVDALKKKVGS